VRLSAPAQVALCPRVGLYLRPHVSKAECASGKNPPQSMQTLQRRRCQTRTRPRKKACVYGARVSGATIFAYVEGNPLSVTDANGLDPWGREAFTPARVFTDMTGGTTMFVDPMRGTVITIPTKNDVTTAAQANGADTPYTGNVTKCQRGFLGRSFGTAKMMTTDPRYRWVHGGGSGLLDPYARRQGWKPTEGCTRAQNEDIEALCDAIEDYQRSNPGVAIPYGRYK
jgi:hypothetical protein